jgi:hypothetical protein
MAEYDYQYPIRWVSRKRHLDSWEVKIYSRKKKGSEKETALHNFVQRNGKVKPKELFWGWTRDLCDRVVGRLQAVEAAKGATGFASRTVRESCQAALDWVRT